jgi:NADPH2:quinone reductase
MIEAATLPLSGCTAYESLEKLSLENSSNLLIVGGAGGVGSWATLVARTKHPRLEIICTASSEESKRWCFENGASSCHRDMVKYFRNLVEVPMEASIGFSA